MRALNIKEDKFCTEYVKTGNGTKAAIIAGYSQRSATVTASRLLTKANIQEKIDYLKQNIAETIGVNPAMIANELRKIAFAQAGDTRTSWVTLKDFKKLSEDTKAAISEVHHETKTVDGKKEAMVKIKFHSKISAIEELNKMLGYNAPQKIDLTNKGEKFKTTMPVININMPKE